MSKEKFLKLAYQKLQLNDSQKKDLHVLLISITNDEDLMALTKKVATGLKVNPCCKNPHCLCGPRATRQSKPFKNSILNERVSVIDEITYRSQAIERLYQQYLSSVRYEQGLAELRHKLRHHLVDDSIDRFKMMHNLIKLDESQIQALRHILRGRGINPDTIYSNLDATLG